MRTIALPWVRPLLKKAVLGAALVASAGALGCAEHHYPHRYYETERVTVVEEAPPPVREEVVTVRPDYEAVWVRGHYDYVGRHYVWVPGRWERVPHRGAIYVEGRWVHVDRGYRWEPGYWR